MRIQHNIPAMNALTHYTNNNNALAKNLEKLSSGYKINSAADDAAGLAISEKMRSQIAGLEKAYDNTNDGISLVQTAEGALTEVNSMLTRLKTLATQSANGTYQEEVDREAIQQETNDILDEIDRIAQSTNFNGIKLLDGSLGSGSGTVSGVKLETADATAGQFSLNAIAASTTAFVSGDVDKTFEYTVEWLDSSGESKNSTVKFTLRGGDGGAWDSATTANNYLELEDGSKINLAAAGTVTSADIADAIVAALKSDQEFNANFKVTSTPTATTLKFEARQAGGTNVPTISGTTTKVLDEKGQSTTSTGNILTTAAPGNATVVSGTDEMQYFDASKLQVVTNGDKVTNDGAATDIASKIFEINGHKFVLAQNDLDAATTNRIGDDVTVVELQGANWAANGADNTKELAAEIERVTGLKTDGNTTNEVKFTEDKLSTGGKHAPLTLQVGDTNDSYQKVSVAIDDMSSKGIGIAGLDLSSQDAAGEAIDTIKNAVNIVSAQRGKLGALQNRLDHTLNNLDAMTENITSAEAQIRDTNMAKEMTAYTKNNILAQAAQSMLAQANSMPQGVLQLLQ